MNVLKLGRKVLTVSTVFSTMLWSVGVSALVPAMAQAETCPTFKSGDLIKVTGKPAIYAVDANGKVLYFPSGDEFKSWNSDEKYGGYTAISQACYDALPLPSMAPMGVNFRAGSYVVKRPSSDQLYVVEPGNTLAKVTPEVAKALYGTSYKVKTVADVFWTNYVNRGADLTEAKPHAGMLVSNAGKTYLVNADGSLSQVTATGFTANRFKQAFVRPVASVAGYTLGAEVAAEVAATADRTQTGGGSTSIPGGVVSGGAVSVSLAMDNPAAGYLASGTAFNNVLKVVLTAGSSDVAVTGITLKKSGFASNTAINGADIIDSSGVRHGNVASSIDTDNNLALIFSSSPIVVKANSSQTVTIRVNVSSSGTTGTLQFSVAGSSSVTTNGGSVSGNFPVTGNIFTLQSGANAIANVSLNVQVVATTTVNVDSTNEQDITKFRLAESSSQENVVLKSLTIYNNGTSADSDVQDVQLVAQDGTVLATAQQSGKNVVFNLATPYVIDKGTTKDFTVRAKLVNGANRTVVYQVFNNYDAVIVGQSTGASVLPTGTFPTASINTVTIGTGSLSFNKDVSSPSSAITPATNGVVLAKFFVKPTGESMELRTIDLGIIQSPGAVLTGSVVVRVNGASVWSGSSATTSFPIAGTAQSITLSSYPTLTAGQNSYITVEGNIMSGAASANTVQVRLNPTQVKRLITNDFWTPSTGITTGNSLAVQAAALKVTNLATPVAQNVVAGTSGVTLAKVELNAGASSSGEDVKVSKVIITDTKVGGALTDIGNLVLYDAAGNPLATTASTVVNAGTNAFNFSSPIVVPKTGSVILTLKGDVLTGNSGSHTFAVATSTDVTATGATTGNTVTPGTIVGSGQALTITGSGTVSLSVVTGGSAAPSVDQTVLVGATNVPVFAFKVSAQNEAVKVRTLTLTASGTLGTVNDLANVKLTTDSGLTIGSPVAQGTLGSNTITFTWTASDQLFTVNPNSSVTVYAKADIGGQGLAKLGDSFVFKINSSTTDVTGVGASSNVAFSATGGATVSAVSYVVPFSVAVAGDYPVSPVTTLVSGSRLATFKITNNGSSQITVTSTVFTDSGAHATNNWIYEAKVSSENSTDYNATSIATSTGLSFSPSFTISGGAYRYVSVYLNSGTVASGDSAQIGVNTLGSVKYSVVETDLGYDVNADGNVVSTDVARGLIADGKASMSTVSKP